MAYVQRLNIFSNQDFNILMYLRDVFFYPLSLHDFFGKIKYMNYIQEYGRSKKNYTSTVLEIEKNMNYDLLNNCIEV